MTNEPKIYIDPVVDCLFVKACIGEEWTDLTCQYVYQGVRKFYRRRWLNRTVISRFNIGVMRRGEVIIAYKDTKENTDEA